MTVRDRSLAAEGLAAVQNPGEGQNRDADTHASASRAHARVRLLATERDGNDSDPTGLIGTAWADWGRAWWRTAQPADLATVTARRLPTADDVPDGAMPLRVALGVWIHAVAIPATWLLLPVARVAGPLRQLLYGLTWALQDPARSFLAALIAGPVIAMWIAF